MFPPFVQSFGDQFFAVMINLIGTISGAIFTSVVSAIATNILAPMLQGFAQSVGITTA